MRISDWRSDVCSSDLQQHGAHRPRADAGEFEDAVSREWSHRWSPFQFPAFRRRPSVAGCDDRMRRPFQLLAERRVGDRDHAAGALGERSEEHTSELQSLMRISYAVFCLKKKKTPRPRLNRTR